MYSNDYPVMIFRREYKDKVFYNMSLSKKEKDGSYTNGYMPCQFKLGIDIPDKTKIYIEKAYLTFYLKDKETHPYIFISEYKLVEDAIKEAKNPFEEMSSKVESDIGEQISITDEDLPF